MKVMFFINKLLNLVPLKLYRLAFQRPLMGVNYHIVSDNNLKHTKHLFCNKTITEFKHDLIQLKNNFNIISYEDFISGKVLTNEIILTFDDGYKELHSIIFPLLKELNIPAIFFITSSFINNNNFFYRNKVSVATDKVLSLNKKTFDSITEKLKQKQLLYQTKEDLIDFLKKSTFLDLEIIDVILDTLNIDTINYAKNHDIYLNSENILELSNHPLITIGAHSIDHRELYLLDKDRNELKNQIINSVLSIRKITNQEVIPFAFPYTSKGVNRIFLNDLIQQHPYIKGLFGECNLSKHEEKIVKRFPGENSTNKTDIIKTIKSEYIIHFKDSLINYFSHKKSPMAK